MVLFFVFICFQLNGDLNCNVMVYFGELPRFLSVFYLNDGLDSGVAAFGVCCSDCMNMRHYLLCLGSHLRTCITTKPK